MGWAAGGLGLKLAACSAKHTPPVEGVGTGSCDGNLATDLEFEYAVTMLLKCKAVSWLNFAEIGVMLSWKWQSGVGTG